MIKLVSCMRIARTVRPTPIILIVFPSHSFMNSLSIPGKRQTAFVAIKALTLSMPGKARKKRIPVPIVCTVSKSKTRANSRTEGVSYVWKKDSMWVEDSNSVVHLHDTDADAVEEVEQLRGSKGKEDTPQPSNLRMKLASEYSHRNHLSSVGRVGERALVGEVEVASRKIRRAKWQWLYLVVR